MRRAAKNPATAICGALLALSLTLPHTSGNGTQCQDKHPSDDAAIYQSILSELGKPHREQLQLELNKLKTFSKELQSRLDRAPKSANFDRRLIEKEFSAITSETDFDKRRQRVDEFRARYEQQFASQASAVGIELSAERQRMSALLGFAANSLSPGFAADSRNLQIASTPPSESMRAEDRPPARVASSIIDRFAVPYTGAGTAGTDIFLAHASASSNSGSLEVNTALVSVGVAQTRAFLIQKLSLRAGIRRARVTVELNDVAFSARADSILGEVSAEAIVNLRVLDGSRVVAGTRRSLGRAATALYGFGGPSGRGLSLALASEFDASAVASPHDLMMVIEFEGLIGVNGLSLGSGSVSMSGRSRQFTVTSAF